MFSTRILSLTLALSLAIVASASPTSHVSLNPSLQSRALPRDDVSWSKEKEHHSSHKHEEMKTVTKTGVIKIVGASSCAVLGFISSTANRFGELMVTSGTDRLQVSITIPVCDDDESKISGPVDIIALNGLTSFPHVGGIQGFSSPSPDLHPGSFNYLSLGGVTQTPAGSPPLVLPNSFTEIFPTLLEAVESAIWLIDNDYELMPQWINTDTSKPATHLTVVNTSPSAPNILFATGDIGVFTATFGANTPVNAIFVPDC